MTHSDFLPASKPVLWDVVSCEEWLARATLADSRHACSALLSLLDELEDAPPRHAPYLQILERLRDPILIAQEENTKKFAARPLPLGHVESLVFNQACDLWMVLLRAYRRLLRAALKGTRPELAVSVPLLCERAIEYTGELIGVHFLARREIGEDLWHWMHEAYALAERQGVADVAVAEPRSRTSSSSTCATAYVRLLMLALAHPYGLRERELAWARRWLRRWAEKARVVPESRTETERGYRIDLSGAAGPQWHDGQHGGPTPAVVRYLDFAQVARSIKWRLKKLEEGALPAELGLGRDCTQPATGELLGALLSSWTRPPRARQFPRHVTHTATELASGMTQIHAALGGEAIVEDVRHWDYSRHDTERIHIFQRAVGFESRRGHAVSGVEQWNTLDESASGFRLQRCGPGTRLAHHQLVAIRPQGAQQFILCELRWLFQGVDQTLTVGARALVGLAQPVAVRPQSEDAAKPSPFRLALVLPLAKDLSASIVLPSGWHQPGRTLDLRAEGPVLHIRLTELLARGYDFDHARFDFVS